VEEHEHAEFCTQEQRIPCWERLEAHDRRRQPQFAHLWWLTLVDAATGGFCFGCRRVEEEFGEIHAVQRKHAVLAVCHRQIHKPSVHHLPIAVADP
jgi:hypothetical protein